MIKKIKLLILLFTAVFCFSLSVSYCPLVYYLIDEHNFPNWLNLTIPLGVMANSVIAGVTIGYLT